MKLQPETGYFTVTKSGARTHRLDFKFAALAAYYDSRVERVIEIERVIVNGAPQLRERDVTTRAVDFLSTLESHV